MSENKKDYADKQVKISPDRHQKLKLLSVKTGKEMREIINEAFDLYFEKHKGDKKWNPLYYVLRKEYI